MKPKIWMTRAFPSNFTEIGPNGLWPTAQPDVFFWLQLDITIDEKVDDEIFDTAVISGQYLHEYEKIQRGVPVDCIFAYPTYDPDVVRRDIEQRVSACRGPTYDETLRNLREIMLWQYD